MRFASLSWRLGAAALLLGGAGCSTVSDNFNSIKSAVTPGPGGQAAVPLRPAPPVYEAPVNPTTQRAFDDASRALRSGRVDEAERAYRSLAQASPELGGPHANLGVIYRQAGKLSESAAELEQAARLSPRQPIFLNQLAITYRQQGQFAKARDAYQKAIALDPGYAVPALNLGILYDLYLGDTQRALEQYARYLALTPNGDATVTKWVADLKNRKPGPITVSRQEKP
jgi:Flp pilus assembly protein TadD